MKNNYILGTILVIFFLMLPVERSEAASLYLSPSSGEYPVSRNISIKVMVDSSGQAINAVDGTISFPADMLEVQTISKSGSVLVLWPKEPIFSAGQVSFSGGVPAPGFTGVGNILTINFVVKKEGELQIYFSKSLILAADGRGTDVLEIKSGASFKAVAKEAQTASSLPKKEENSDLPVVTDLSSSTHSDQNIWYGNSNPVFTWKNSTGITELSYELYEEKNKKVSDFISEELVSSKIYSEVKSGVWQFHIRAKNNNGWGKDSSFKINIDKDSPDPFEIRIDDYGDPTSPQPSLYFEAKDSLSGIARYEVKIGDEGIISIPVSQTNPYVVPIRMPGLYKVSINAVDNANNRRESSTTMNIKSIEIPEITVRPDEYNAGEEVLYLEGKSVPNADVTIFIKEYEVVIKEWKVRSDENGSWSLKVNDLFRSGNYEIFTKAKDQRGAVSYPSEKRALKIVLKGIALGPWLFDYWTFSLLLLILIIAAIIILLNIFYRIRKEKKRIDKEAKKAEESLKNTFKKLRHDLEKKIEYLDSKPGLNVKERRIRDEVFKILRDSEKIIYKEIRDIEDEL